MTSARSAVLVATILGSSMVFIDGTAVNVVLPVLQTDLHANAVQLQWVVVGYSLFLSSLILAGGSLGDHYGRRKMFVIGTVVFAAASIACGFAPNAAALIIARCIQGIGSAMLTPGSLALIGANFDEQSRGKAIGTWSSATAVMAALGPGLGGFLAQHVSWRSIFFINVPLAIGVVIIALRAVPESRDHERVHHLDWLGAFACTAGLGLIAYGLTFASTTWTIVGVILLGAFVVIEARSKSPLVPLDLFRSPTFSAVNALTLLLYGGLAGVTFFLPFEMIQVDGYTPTAAGFAFLPFIAIIFTLSPIAGALMPKIGARVMLVVGPLVVAAGFVLLGLAGGHIDYWTAYLPAIVVIGIGMGFTVAPLTTTAIDAADADQMGVASGVNNAVSRVAGMLAIAGLGALVLSLFSNDLQRELKAVGVPPSVASAVMAQRASLAATTAPADSDAATKALVHRAVDGAYLAAYRIVMFACAGLAAAGALVVVVSVAPRRVPRPVTPIA
ncbi:MAG TPA: MFS transporter [Candidatus Eremiobacteraceae bacterium]|nr:MFS transporter [Candidatus Eremiobacteraceae bacterium]